MPQIDLARVSSTVSEMTSSAARHLSAIVITGNVLAGISSQLSTLTVAAGTWGGFRYIPARGDSLITTGETADTRGDPKSRFSIQNSNHRPNTSRAVLALSERLETPAKTQKFLVGIRYLPSNSILLLIRDRH